MLLYVLLLIWPRTAMTDDERCRCNVKRTNAAINTETLVRKSPKYILPFEFVSSNLLAMNEIMQCLPLSALWLQACS